MENQQDMPHSARGNALQVIQNSFRHPKIPYTKTSNARHHPPAPNREPRPPLRMTSTLVRVGCMLLLFRAWLPHLIPDRCSQVEPDPALLGIDRINIDARQVSAVPTL